MRGDKDPTLLGDAWPSLEGGTSEVEWLKPSKGSYLARLASAAGSYITGTTLTVDGGHLLGMG